VAECKYSTNVSQDEMDLIKTAAAKLHLSISNFTRIHMVQIAHSTLANSGAEVLQVATAAGGPELTKRLEDANVCPFCGSDNFYPSATSFSCPGGGHGGTYDPETKMLTITRGSINGVFVR
jgi:uncharacterized protein (DUF1778 family)